MELLKIIILMQGLNYIADYPLQGDFLGTMKSKYNYLLFVHCFIWTTCIMAGLIYFGLFEWWKILFLFILHFLIDKWKCRNKNKEEKGFTSLLWIDQLLHFIQILIVVC
jgi:hypothetical protein